MSSRFFHALALAGLLVQAVFGALAPAAAICINQHAHQGHHGPAGFEHEICPPADCCPGEAASETSSIKITVPCSDGCSDCVDITLMDLNMLLGSRADLALSAPAPIVLSALLVQTMSEPHAWGEVNRRTEPPERVGCPHAAVIRTTRLLI